MPTTRRRLTFLIAGTGILAVISLATLFGVAASAQTSFSIEDIGSSIGLGTADLKDTLINIIQWVLGILALVAVAFIIYGGVLWLTAAGRVERIEKAKKVILGAVIGLVIVLLAWAIVLFVARFITGGGGGGGTTCTPGEIHPTNSCFECNGAGTGYQQIVPPPPGCTVTATQFTLEEVETAHGGTFNYSDVFLCSKVQAQFNHRVDAATVAAAMADGLKITRKSDGAAVIGTWKTVSDSIVYSQESHCQNNPSQTCSSDAECGGSTCGKLLEPNTAYVGHFPTSIEDVSGNFLQNCIASGVCMRVGNEFLWEFTTGTGTDSTAPVITSTYPTHTGAGYPDRNVPRQPVWEVNFSEAIDLTTVIDENNSPHPIAANVILEQLDGQGGTVVTTVDVNTLSVSGKTAGFRFSLDAPNALEPFTWYRLTIANVQDLCGNSLSPQLTWEFQTNDAIAGVKSVYPTGTNRCPDTNIMVTFGTTMWDNWVKLTVAGSGPPLVIQLDAPASFTGPPYERTIAGVGTLRVLDTNTAPVDNNFRVYEFNPENSLAASTTYTVTVDTDRVINASGATLTHQWQFGVTTADQCACAPYVARFSPDQGPPGQCVTLLGSCFAGTPAHPAQVTDVQYGVDLASPVQGTIGGATATQITSTIPPNDFTDGDRVKARVEITFDDAAFGTETGDSTGDFFVNSTAPANGPCLFSLEPDRGFHDTEVKAKGIRFGEEPPAQSLAEIHFEDGNGGANASWTIWTDTLIETTVPPFAVDGDVDVHNDAGVSNPIFFDVLFPPPSSPVVLGHWPTCDAACLNAGMGAQFNLEMDAATISPASVAVQRCATSACDAFDQNISIPSVSYFYDAASGTSQADWAATGSLDADRWYRVIMRDSIAAPDGGTISNLNYDANNDATDDSFSWKFKTGTIDCSVERLETQPLFHTFTQLGTRQTFLSTAYGQADSCSAQGQRLNANLFSWNWTTADAAKVAIGSDTDNTSEATSVAETVPNPPVDICAVIASESVQDCSPVVVDLAHCSETTDCADPDGDGADQCPGSVCDDQTSRCTPVITTLNPTQGPAGQWTTVGGCYFGSYRTNTCLNQLNKIQPCATDNDCPPSVPGGPRACTGSRVIFTDSKLGQLPAICGPAGATWSDSSIVVEVPNNETPGDPSDDAVTGPVAVVRGLDRVRADSTGDFTVSSDAPGPGICFAQPNRGPEQTQVSLIGQNFGANRDEPAGDKVVFYDGKEVANYVSWSDTNVTVRVPAGATTNNVSTHPWYPGEISLLKGTVWSNAVNFSVETTSCAVSCSTDSECTGALGAGFGCSATGCCAPAPSIQSRIPAAGATNVCRNSLVEINFDMAMAGGTLNANNVILSYVDGAGTTIVATPTSVSRDADTIRLTYGLLQAATTYTVTAKEAITNTNGVHLPADQSWNFTTLPSDADNSGVCELASVAVTPTSHTFNTAGQTQPFSAQGYDNLGNPLTPISGVYDWTWSWSSTDSAVASVSGAATDSDVATAVANGKTLIVATATSGAGWNGTRVGLASVEVDFCVNPWEFVDQPNNCVIGTCPENLNFSTRYCRDRASGPPLPELLKNIPVRGRLTASSTLMKQYLFKHPDDDDGVGIRVFDNPTLLSVRDWYEQQVPNPGTVSQLTVDGYEAIRDGTSVYIGMANLTGGELKGRIVLLSFNQGASADINTIFGQLLKNMRFNTNISGACQADPPLENKVCIARDLKRINDLNDIASILNGFRVEGGASSTSNRVNNAGFETDDGTNYDQAANYDNATAGDNIPNGWSFGQRDGLAKHAGNFSVKLDAGNYTFQDVPVSFGKSYIVSGWIKTDLDAVTRPNGKAVITAECVDGNHAVDPDGDCGLNHPIIGGLNGERDWTRQSFVVEATKANRPFVRISCYNGPPNHATSGTIWCDDLAVIEGSSLYPDLSAGSFIAGMSVSRWPQSWTGTLANALKKSLPVDPLNTLENCPASYDQTACWNEQTTTFYCDPASHVYAYTTDSGANYTLYANLEYEGAGRWTDSGVAGTNICNDGRSSCSCFDYAISSP